MNEICYTASVDMMSADQARESIISAIRPLTETELVDTSLALGRILARSINSPIAIPPHRNAAMDGYAFNSRSLESADDYVPLTLRVVGTSWAGRPFTGNLKIGECIRIMTGAVVPEQADSVVAQEQVQRIDNTVLLHRNLALFRNIRNAGSDVAAGDILLLAPRKLTARDLSLLVSAGVQRIEVYRRLNIAFFSTGDELIDISQRLQNGQIYDSNRYLLSGLLVDSNHIVTDLGVVGDDQDQLEKRLISASEKYDVIISSGGASVGDADFVKQALQRCGRINFWKLAVKPGKPLAFGQIGRCWFFGLPGNPVAVWVTFEQFVKQALQTLAGESARQRLRLHARCLDKLRKTPGRSEYQRGILRQLTDGDLVVSIAGGQESYQMRSAGQANCFILLDADCGDVEIGEWVWVEPLTTEL